MMRGRRRDIRRRLYAIIDLLLVVPSRKGWFRHPIVDIIVVGLSSGLVASPTLYHAGNAYDIFRDVSIFVLNTLGGRKTFRIPRQSLAKGSLSSRIRPTSRMIRYLLMNGPGL